MDGVVKESGSSTQVLDMGITWKVGAVGAVGTVGCHPSRS